MMDDRMRVSDADREQVTARLREHYAEGRLTSEELDERITATLSAKTFGDLRRVMADLPEPAPTGPRAGPPPPWTSTPPQWRQRPGYYRRGPRLLPLLLIALLAALILPGVTWAFFGIFKILLLIWLVMIIAGLLTRRRRRRYW
jgi:hypothetical protein